MTESLIKPGKNYKVYNKKKGFDALFLFSYFSLFLLFFFSIFLFSYYSLFVSLFFSFNNKIKISHKSSLNSRSSTRTI